MTVFGHGPANCDLWLTVAAAPASAADLFGTSPPLTYPATQGPTAVEVGSNWYVRGDLGISFDDAPTVSFSNVDAPLLPALGPNAHGTDFTGGLGFGYRFNDYLRFDATWDYRPGPGGTRQTIVVCPYGLIGASGGYLYNTADTCVGSTDVRQYNNTFLANGYVDLGTYAGFTPYVGGGLGFNMNVMQGSLNYYETANAQPYAANLTPTITGVPAAWVNSSGQIITPQPNISFSPQNWNGTLSSTRYSVAFALSAGFGFQLNPSTTLDIGYRYLNSGAINTLVNPETGMTVRQNNSSQQFLVGIRYVLQ